MKGLPTAPSGGELSVADDAALDSARRSVPSDVFERGGVIGHGGMGTVEVAREVALLRDVAMKTATVGDTRAGERLIREAQIAGRLDHPGIVPVYRAGFHPDGTPYYTMRLLAGRSLHDAVSVCVTLDDRLRLVHHVMNAAAAISFAHDQGVLHRDVKPANIMVGSLGETVVADWGLALTFEERSGALGRRVGTPAYMSPEQATGALLDGRSDVFSLGATLFEVLSGRPPVGPHLLSLVRQVPPELIAVIRRAMAEKPEDRYATAADLAADLAAWFQGRRVSAHSYGATEVARRFVRAWRPLIIVAALSFLVVAVAMGMSWANTVVERDRALLATAEARNHLATALVGQARSAAERDRGLDAEAAAVLALELEQSPRARGVLARFGGRVRPQRLDTFAWSCRISALSDDGQTGACYEEGVLRRYDLVTGQLVGQVPARPVWLHVAGSRVFYDGPDNTVWIWELGKEPISSTGNMARTRTPAFDAVAGEIAVVTSDGMSFVSLFGELLRHQRTCAPGIGWEALSYTPERDLVAACAQGLVVRQQRNQTPELLASIDIADGTLVEVAVDPLAPLRYAVGTTRGRIHVFEGKQLVRRFDNLVHEPLQIALRGERLAAVVGLDEVVVWNVTTGRQLFRQVAPRGFVVWRKDASLVIADANGVSRWAISDEEPPHALMETAGVASIHTAPDGHAWAVALGDGTALVRDSRMGAITHSFKFVSGVTKDLSFDASSRRLAVVNAAHPDVVVMDLATSAIRYEPGLGGARRISWLGDDLWTATYMPGAMGRSGVETTIFGSLQFLELDANLKRTAVWGLDTSDRLYRNGGGGFVEIAKLPGARRIAPVGEDLVVLMETSLLLLGEDGAVKAEWPVRQDALDIAGADVGGLVAIGYMSAPVSVGRVGEAEPLALLEGHSGRIGSLAFSADGNWLYTGGWDGSERVWCVVVGVADRPAGVAACRDGGGTRRTS